MLNLLIFLQLAGNTCCWLNFEVFRNHKILYHIKSYSRSDKEAYINVTPLHDVEQI